MMPLRVERPVPVLAAEGIRLEETTGGVVLSCRLRGAPGLPETVWFRFPDALAPALAPRGDPFLAALLLLAMRQGGRLIIEGPVSPALLRAVPAIADLFLDWQDQVGEPLAPVTVDAQPVAAVGRGTVAAAFFSCGVDSFYTVLRNLGRYPAGDARRVGDLLLVHGFDVSLERVADFEAVRESATAVAGALGLRLVPIATNVRAVLRSLDWGFTHGPALAAVGLALAGVCHTVYIPATDFLLEMIPWGSHPVLDPLWSTETVEFVHDGAEVRRADKIRALAASPLALRHLRVCWQPAGGAGNCGRCEKCLQTMVDLELAGALAAAEGFPQTVDPAAIERLIIPRLDSYYWLYTLRVARAQGADRRLLAALETTVGRRARANARLRLIEGLGRALRPLGLGSRVRAADRRWLGGAIDRAVRTIRARARRLFYST
ncbi:MAG: hypothetical protein QN159_11940 [Armatimonadota bacterium]|nr:hypothetical protein [Armatimonadota bacterium]